MYYLSRTLNDTERQYTPIKKFCLTLYFVVIKLRHYLLSNTIYLMARTDIIKYMLCRPILHGRIRIWILAMFEYCIQYVLQKIIKG